MIKISKQNNSLIVEGIDNVFYPNNGDNSYPLNSLIVVTDNSDMATFRSVATNDVLFSGLIKDITINGEAVTKDNIIEKFDAVSNSSTGGGGGGGTVDAYTKSEADAKFASKDELNNVQTVANDADTKVDALTTRVEGVETSVDGKQDTLVSGTNIKTINNQSILGEGNIEISDYYTKTEADEIFATTTEVRHQAVDISALQTDMRGKQATLVSGENIKTINSESILGTGDIQINGVSQEQAQEIAKIPTLETELAQKANVSDVPTVQTGEEGTNKNYIYSTPFDNNYSVFSKFTFKPSEEGITMEADLWGSYHNRATLFHIPLVTTSKNGVMSAADKTKLDSIPETIPSQSEIDGIAANVSTLETEIAQKANVSDVPTVQTGSAGTDKNYVYSERDGLNYKGVMSKLEVYTNNAEDVTLAYNLWGSEDRYLVHLPKATTTAAGVMSAADKTKLDSIPENIPTQTEVDNIAANVSTLQTDMMGKQPTLVSGTNIKTINGESVLGEGNLVIEGGGVDLSNYYNKTEVDTKLDAKQNTLVSGTNIKTINSQSILGEGNIEVTIPDATTATSGAMSAADKTKLDSMLNEWTGTQQEYDALTTKDNNTIYYVTE